MRSFFNRDKLRVAKTQLRALKKKIEALEIQEVVKEPTHIEESEETIIEPIIKEPLQATTSPDIQPDKKENVKENILYTIRAENLTGGEVKRKIVDEARLCSKASFYRYVQELKKEGKIESLNINKQEFLYSKE